MAIPLFDLTGFQRDILYVAAGIEEPSGQTIKDQLEQDRTQITHGRLYPNLDTLVDDGYLKKGQIDKRTNQYTVSERGRRALTARRHWENRRVAFD